MRINRFFINRFKEETAGMLFLLAAVLSLGLLLAIIVFLFANGIPFLADYGFGKFLFGTKWAPLAESPLFGILPMIVTTLIVTFLSTAIGCVIGLFVAISLYAFLPGFLVKPIHALIDLLSGIPSVIYGLFGLYIIVPFIRDYVSGSGVGYGMLSATIILSIMILPTMVSCSYDALRAVPETYYEGAVGLGASRSQAVFQVMVRSAKRGILGAAVLSSGRALGETMAVIMVIGGSPVFPKSLTQSVRTLTANIAMGANELTGDALSALICCGVVLFVMSLLLNIVFVIIERKGAKA